MPVPGSSPASSAGGPASSSSAAAQPSTRFEAVLGSLGARIDRGEALLTSVTQAGSVGSLDAGQLIAVQAGIYRYTEAVDLSTRLVDRSCNAITTVLRSGSH